MIDAPWVLQLFSFAAFILGALSMGQWMARPRRNIRHLWFGIGFFAVGCLLVLAKLIIQ